MDPGPSKVADMRGVPLDAAVERVVPPVVTVAVGPDFNSAI